MYKHDENKLDKAIGIDKKELRNLKAELMELSFVGDEQKVSEKIEKLENIIKQKNPTEIAYMIYSSIQLVRKSIIFPMMADVFDIACFDDKQEDDVSVQ